eukprot:scaffold34647_cov66-Phaeocystis_antarctica.AAC.2
MSLRLTLGWDRRVTSTTTAGLPGRCCRFQCNQRSSHAAHAAAAVQVAGSDSGSDSGATASATASGISTAAGAAIACSARAEVAGGVLPYDLSIFTASCEVVDASVVLSDGSAAAADASAAEEAGGALGSAGWGGLVPAPRCTASVRSSETRADAELSRSSSRLVGCRLVRKVVAWRFERMSVWKRPERITSSSIVTGSGRERGMSPAGARARHFGAF